MYLNISWLLLRLNQGFCISVSHGLMLVASTDAGSKYLEPRSQMLRGLGVWVEKPKDLATCSNCALLVYSEERWLRYPHVGPEMFRRKTWAFPRYCAPTFQSTDAKLPPALQHAHCELCRTHLPVVAIAPRLGSPRIKGPPPPFCRICRS